MSHSLQIIWNPSEGIDLGFFMIRFYSLMFVVAFGLGWYIMKYIYLREKLTMEQLDKLFVYTVFATLIGARLGHVFFYDWDYFKDHKAEILLPIRQTSSGWEFTGFAGLASHGAAFSIIIVMYYYSKKIIQKPILWILDRVVIPISLGAIFVRLGNFFNSEIIGKPSDKTAFLATKFIRAEENIKAGEVIQLTQINDLNKAYEAIEKNPEFSDLLSSIPYRYPAQLYEALGYVFVFLLLLFLYWKTNAREKMGLLFGAFLISLWSIRFLVEFVKESQGGFESILKTFSTGQWLSIPFILIGLYFTLRTAQKKA